MPTCTLDAPLAIGQGLLDYLFICCQLRYGGMRDKPGRGRDVLIALWQACAVRQARASTPLEAHIARKAAPVPRNIGCPYATLYCDHYW